MIKKVKLNNKSGKKFEFSNECIELKKEFTSKMNYYNQNSPDNDKRIKMLIARKKYRRAIDLQKNLSKEKKVNKLQGLDKSDPKVFWKSIKSMLNSNTPPTSISEDNWVDYFQSLLNTKSEKDNQFMVYVNESLKLFERYQESTNTKLNEEISISELNQAVKELKNNKAAGIDNITNEMIKCSLPYILENLRELYNFILLKGEFPNNWNCAILTPIFKSGQINDPNNYRGIAVSNCLSKILMKILAKRINTHMSDNKLWTKNQNGFKQKSRTEDNLFILKTLIYETNVKNNKPLYTCFVDFSKYFDKIDRKLLLYN